MDLNNINKNDLKYKNPKYGYSACGRCRKNTMILDFGTRRFFCTHCSNQGTIKDQAAKEHFIQIKMADNK